MMDYFGEPSNVFYPPSNSPSRTATVESLGNRLGRTPPRPALKQNGDGSANDYERKTNAVTFVEDVPHADGLKEVRVIISSSFEDEDSYEEDRGSSPEKRKKKKKYRRGPRDSLASRMQVGKPGSRRHQRYLNKAHLTDEETDEEDPFTLINGEVQPPEWRSAFQDVLDSPEKQRFMEPFLDTPLEEEQAFLDALDEEEDDSNRVTLDRLSRKMLVKYYGTDFLTDLDKHISAFAEIVGRSPSSKTVVQPKLDLFSQHFATKVDFVRERMTITFKDSFHRLLAHSVCRYYSLTSNSENCNGTRVTVITLPRHCARPISLPPLPLQDFLAKERSHVISSRAS